MDGFAGFSSDAWSFAFRNWFSMTVALFVAFWMQLESASTAAVCVGILALQTRGQIYQKAIYRAIGTVVGVMVGLAIAGLFSQTRELFFLSCAVWLGLCTSVSSMMNGNPAYAVILSGYTVAIVAFPNIDRPMQTFATGVDRGAAISIGIFAVAIVSDLLFAPDLFPGLLQKLEALQHKVKVFAGQALQQGLATPAETATMLKEIAGLYPDVTALSSESARGKARSAAAGETLASLVRVLSAARVMSNVLTSLGQIGDDYRGNLARAFKDLDHWNIRERALAVAADPDSGSREFVAAAACLVLFEAETESRKAIQAMREARTIPTRAPMTFYKSGPAALRNGVRAALTLMLSAWFLALIGWSSTVTTLIQLSAMVALGSTMSDPRGLAKTSLIALPIAALLSGVTQLFIAGADQFELLALAMAPSILLSSLFIASGNPALGGIGYLLIVFFPALLAPSNPQTYNTENFVSGIFLSVLASVLLYIVMSVVLPTTPGMQARWMIRSAGTDLRRAIIGRRRWFDARASDFRDADRIGQFSALKIEVDRDKDLRHLFRLSDLAACARRLRNEVPANSYFRHLGRDVQAALQTPDPVRLQELGRTVLLEGNQQSAAGEQKFWILGADLLFAALLIDHDPQIVDDLQNGRLS